MAQKILVVDDEHFVRNLLAEFFTPLGYQVITTEDGNEALELAAREAPDVILLDVVMPGLDGAEACKALRGSEKTALIPVIMMKEHFEVVDLRRRQSLDTFTLSDARRHVRAMAYEVDPQHRTMMLVARTATRLLDRWEIGAPEFIQYDLAEHKVIRTVPWSADFVPSYYSAVLRYSPDGKLLYVFGHEILIYDAATMVKVDAWDLSVPIESGMGRLDPGSFDESMDRPGFVTGVFTMRDALQNRNLLVVGQINLAARSIETFPLGPAVCCIAAAIRARGQR